jgi:NH3-dependent NAD+ synthetase
MKGITDEFALGMRYAKIDLVLDYLDGGLTKKEITEAGCYEEEIYLVRELNRMSHWKREPHQIPPPVDGGLKGGLRTKQI